MRIARSVYLTEQGSRRKDNQDGVLSLARVPLFAVADGNGGAEAARIALTVFKDQSVHLTSRNAAVATNPNTSTRLAVGRFFQSAFDKANAALQEANADRAQRLAATVVAATVTGPYAFIAHIGDARAYLFRDKGLSCLTHDHTLAALQLRRGDISLQEYESSPFRSTLSQALGASATLEVDVAEVRLMPRDVVMLCTNGLHRFVGHDRIAQCFAETHDLDALARRLGAAVHEAGVPDDVTVVLFGAESSGRVERDPKALEAAVRSVFLFEGLSDPEWLRVAPYLERLELQTGEQAIAAGDTAAAMYFVAHGSVEVRQLIERRELGPTGHFGAVSLALDTPQLDTVTALEPTVIFALSRARFHELLRYHPALGARLALALLEALGERLGVLTVRLGKVLEAVHGNLPRPPAPGGGGAT